MFKKIIYEGQAQEKRVFIDRDWVRYPRGIPVPTCFAWSEILLRTNQFREAKIEDVLNTGGKLNVLFVRKQGLGDVMMVVGVIEKFKEVYKNSNIYLATDLNFKDLLVSGINYVNINNIDFNNYDFVVNLEGITEESSNNKNKKRIDVLLEKTGLDNNNFFLKYSVLENDKKWAKEVVGGKMKRIIGLVLKSSSFHRDWRLDYYRKLITLLGVEKYIYVLLDREKIGWESEGIIDMTGKTTIREAIALLEQCDLVVTPDTGLLHASVAVKTPVVAIFGSIDPDLRISYYDNCNAISMKGKLPCCPCADNPRCSSPTCMDMITPEMVKDEVEKFFEKDALVSVIIVSKGGEEREDCLKKCLDNLDKQTLKKSSYEIILVLKDKVNFSIGDSIRVIYQVKKGLKDEQSISDARMIGVRKAKGRYISFIDDDNVIHSNYLSIFLDSVNDSKVYSCNYVFNDLEEKKQEIRKPIYDEKEFEKRNIYPFDSLFFHKSVFDEFCLNEKLEYFDDWEFFSRVFKKYKPYHIDRELLFYNHSKKSLGEIVRREGKGEFYFNLAKSVEKREKDWVSIVMPVWFKDEKQVEILDKCLSSITEMADGFNYDVLLVNDNSLYEFDYDNKPYEVIKTPHNMLFSNTVNYGVDYLRKQNRLGEYLLIMNYDIIIETKDFLNKLKSKIFDKNKIIGILLKFPNNTIQFAGGVVNTNNKEIISHYKYRDEIVKFDNDYYIDYCTGAFIFMKSETFLNYGMFDSNILHTYEDSDFCLRVRVDGGKVLFTPQIEAIHYENTTDYKISCKVELTKSMVAFWNRWKDKLIRSEFE